METSKNKRGKKNEEEKKQKQMRGEKYTDVCHDLLRGAGALELCVFACVCVFVCVCVCLCVCVLSKTCRL